MGACGSSTKPAAPGAVPAPASGARKHNNRQPLKTEAAMNNTLLAEPVPVSPKRMPEVVLAAEAVAQAQTGGTCEALAEAEVQQEASVDDELIAEAAKAPLEKPSEAILPPTAAAVDSSEPPWGTVVINEAAPPWNTVVIDDAAGASPTKGSDAPAVSAALPAPPLCEVKTEAASFPKGDSGAAALGCHVVQKRAKTACCV